MGGLIERALGVPFQNRAEPDFASLGVELKTLPISPAGRPIESTFVTTAPLQGIARVKWEESVVRAKLMRVLWLPVEADRGRPIAARRVGSPLLWSPSEGEQDALRADWEDIAQMIAAGFVDSITAHRGSVLQLRPKAAHGRKRTWADDDDGGVLRTLPRGFYLRRAFTRAILERNFILPQK